MVLLGIVPGILNLCVMIICTKGSEGKTTLGEMLMKCIMCVDRDCRGEERTELC